ncbi:MAG: hypothetical protein U0800_15345 [Isosphaeraceae bacterium]
MGDVVYLPEVRCTVRRGGLYPNGITVSLTDAQGVEQHIQMADGMVLESGGVHYLPVGVAEIRRDERRALVELPMVADSGYHRIWVGFDAFRRDTLQHAGALP